MDPDRKFGPVVNGEPFPPGYTPETANYEQRTRTLTHYQTQGMLALLEKALRECITLEGTYVLTHDKLDDAKTLERRLMAINATARLALADLASMGGVQP